MKTDQGTIDDRTINSLIETLESKDGLARQRERNALLKIGQSALNALIKAFEEKRGYRKHWEGRIICSN